MNDSEPLVALDAVQKRYDGADARLVLNDCSLKIQEGESLAIVGPSGSGKTTLLNLIGALDTPTAGTLTIASRDLSQMNADELADLRNQEIGFIFQLHFLLPQLTVLENVLTPTLASKHPHPDAEERARRLLERVGLGERINARPGQISGGERQRAAVVRALINEPKLLLADEPTGSLDRRSADSLTELLLELNREEGVALVVVTHSETLAQRMSRILELRDGRLQPWEASQ
ncbi:ABC transporter ATP-binding protein [bacterium]|nr:ABC transporter ATP-binding protein [bacterium]